MSAFEVPLSSGDLKVIARELSRWEKLLVKKDGDWTDRANLISRIEVYRPEDTEVIGHFVLEDGWVGFRPIAGDE